MARTAKSSKTKTAPTKKLATKTSKPVRGSTAVAKSPGKIKTAATPKQAKSAPAAKAPKLSVAELRAQLEKLERANATLRTKRLEAGRTAKTAAARIAELEANVTGLEKKLAKTAAPAAGRAKRKSRVMESGDSAPPSMEVTEPAQIEDADETGGED